MTALATTCGMVIGAVIIYVVLIGNNLLKRVMAKHYINKRMGKSWERQRKKLKL